MLSKKTKYAIKALVLLAKSTDLPPMSAAAIAETERIPKKFLEQILFDLTRAGYIFSKRGAGGGYYLTKPASDIWLVDIMRTTGGPIAMVPCASLKFYHKCEECIDERTCGIRQAFIDVRDATLKILSETSLEDVIHKEKNALSKLPGEILK